MALISPSLNTRVSRLGRLSKNWMRISVQTLMSRKNKLFECAPLVIFSMPMLPVMALLFAIRKVRRRRIAMVRLSVKTLLIPRMTPRSLNRSYFFLSGLPLINCFSCLSLLFILVERRTIVSVFLVYASLVYFACGIATCVFGATKIFLT